MLWTKNLSIAQRTQVEDAILQASLAMKGAEEITLYLQERMTPGEIKEIQRKYAITAFLEDAFDRVLAGVKGDVVPEGQVYLYYVYNLGYVVKTPSVTIGIDICHRRGEELVPYLDFAVITHNHEDHYTLRFLKAMTRAKKLLLNNFYSCGTDKLKYGPGYSKEPFREIAMPDWKVTVRTYESDHLNYQWYKYNMPVELELQTGDRTCVVFTGGDSSNTMQLKCARTPDFYIAHPRVGGDVVHGALLLGAKCTLISHLLELQHQAHSRWSYSVGYSEQKLFLTNHMKSVVPHWGDKIVWPMEENPESGSNFNLHLPQLPEEKPLRIMPVGDSITRGTFHSPQLNYFANAIAGGYRKPLQILLKKAGIPYQFVGELNYWAYGEQLGNCDPEFQRYHHGLSGFSNRTILAGDKLPPSDLRKICRVYDPLPQYGNPLYVPDIKTSLERWKPEVILLMSGSNGFDASMRNQLIQMIADNFDGILLVANIPPQKPPRPSYERVEEYNFSLPDFLKRLKPAGKCQVHFVDVYSRLTLEDISSDGVHPTQRGLDKIAGAWNEAIQKYCMPQENGK